MYLNIKFYKIALLNILQNLSGNIFRWFLFLLKLLADIVLLTNCKNSLGRRKLSKLPRVVIVRKALGQMLLNFV